MLSYLAIENLLFCPSMAIVLNDLGHVSCLRFVKFSFFFFFAFFSKLLNLSYQNADDQKLSVVFRKTTIFFTSAALRVAYMS